MATQILKAYVKDVHLPLTDARSAFERLQELQDHRIRVRDHLSITCIYHPSNLPSGDYYPFTNNTGKQVPPDNQLFRVYEDGIEQLVGADFDGEVRVRVSCVKTGIKIGINYSWNAANGGMYHTDYDKNKMKIKWE